LLFAKPKSVPSDDAAAVFNADTPKAQALLARVLGAAQGAGATIVRVLKVPLVAPALVLMLLLGSVALFFVVAGAGEDAAKSVRVSMPRNPADKPPVTDQPVPAEAATTGQQAFNLDSIGLFNPSATQTFATGDGDAQGGTALITLPDTPTLPPEGAAAQKPANPLPKAPIAGLSVATPDGPLPIISANGLAASSAYARPFKSDGRPMVALIVGGLGLNPATTRAAIEQLPGEVTLSFVPYTTNLQNWIDEARAHGHEVLIEMPMQPVNYPDNDPGPLTLLANANPNDLTSNLNKVLARATGYFGVINYQGGAFLKDKVGVTSFMNTLKMRGLTFVDDGQARNLQGAWGRASAERIIDDQITGPAINAQLTGLETSARGHGTALGAGFAYPVTLAVALKWTQGLDKKGLQLVPASAITHR
jgi:uncharacterized protein